MNIISSCFGATGAKIKFRWYKNHTPYKTEEKCCNLKNLYKAFYFKWDSLRFFIKLNMENNKLKNKLFELDNVLVKTKSADTLLRTYKDQRYDTDLYDTERLYFKLNTTFNLLTELLDRYKYCRYKIAKRAASVKQL